MSEDTDSAKWYAEALRRERDKLTEQIAKSQATIVRSQELLKKMDEMLAKAPAKP
jgi:hypothetical protein